MNDRLANYAVRLSSDQKNAIFRAEQAWALIEDLPLPGSILDVGCGSGEFLRLASARDVAVVVGIEGPTGAVEAARANGLQIAQLDIESAPFPFEDHSFDLVVCMETLEHLYDPAAVVGRIWRAVKPGGHFIASVPNASNLPYRIRILLGASISPPQTVGGHIKFFRPRDLINMCNGQGFRLRLIRGVAYPTAYQSYRVLMPLLLRASPWLVATWIFALFSKVG